MNPVNRVRVIPRLAGQSHQFIVDEFGPGCKNISKKKGSILRPVSVCKIQDMPRNCKRG
jgi:hypothetical protein